MMLGVASTMLPHVESGKLRALAVSSENRLRHDAGAVSPLVPSPRRGEGSSLLQYEGMGEGVQIQQYRR
jgi:hypothetical protein